MTVIEALNRMDEIMIDCEDFKVWGKLYDKVFDALKEMKENE